MGLLYTTEHLSCYQYSENKISIIDRTEQLKGKENSFTNDTNRLFFVLKGKILISFDNYINEIISENNFFFIPTQCRYNIRTIENSVFLVFSMNMNLNFCDHFSFEMLIDINKKKKNIEDKFVSLLSNETLINYTQALEKAISDGLKCSYFLELKQKELLFLLRAYYSKESLRALFSPSLSIDMTFSNKIYEVSEKVKSVQELAELMNYSLSGFEKRFKRVFGVPAYQWMKKRKARNIYHEINFSKKTFSEIGYEYGFSSSAYFNDFCKANFGKTPGEIRRSKKKMQEF